MTMSTKKTILVHLLCCLFIINCLCEINLCQNRPNGFYPNLNCQSFYSCFNGTLNQTFQCPDPNAPIFSPYRQRCVAKDVLYDECLLTNVTENADNCAWFSVQLSSTPNITHPYSCLYRFLFDRESQQCKHYSQVQCQQRFEPKDACDYHHPQIHHSVDERPCWLTPSCRNKTNGLHGNQLQKCSTYYQCTDERFVSSMICPRRTHFSEKEKACLPTLITCENSTVH